MSYRRISPASTASTCRLSSDSEDLTSARKRLRHPPSRDMLLAPPSTASRRPPTAASSCSTITSYLSSSEHSAEVLLQSAQTRLRSAAVNPTSILVQPPPQPSHIPPRTALIWHPQENFIGPAVGLYAFSRPKTSRSSAVSSDELPPEVVHQYQRRCATASVHLDTSPPRRRSRLEGCAPELECQWNSSAASSGVRSGVENGARHCSSPPKFHRDFGDYPDEIPITHILSESKLDHRYFSTGNVHSVRPKTRGASPPRENQISNSYSVNNVRGVESARYLNFSSPLRSPLSSAEYSGRPVTAIRRPVSRKGANNHHHRSSPSRGPHTIYVRPMTSAGAQDPSIVFIDPAPLTGKPPTNHASPTRTVEYGGRLPNGRPSTQHGSSPAKPLTNGKSPGGPTTGINRSVTRSRSPNGARPPTCSKTPAKVHRSCRNRSPSSHHSLPRSCCKDTTAAAEQTTPRRRPYPRGEEPILNPPNPPWRPSSRHASIGPPPAIPGKPEVPRGFSPVSSGYNPNRLRRFSVSSYNLPTYSRGSSPYSSARGRPKSRGFSPTGRTSDARGVSPSPVRYRASSPSPTRCGTGEPRDRSRPTTRGGTGKPSSTTTALGAAPQLTEGETKPPTPVTMPIFMDSPDMPAEKRHIVRVAPPVVRSRSHTRGSTSFVVWHESANMPPPRSPRKDDEDDTEKDDSSAPGAKQPKGGADGQEYTVTFNMGDQGSASPGGSWSMRRKARLGSALSGSQQSLLRKKLLEEMGTKEGQTLSSEQEKQLQERLAHAAALDSTPGQYFEGDRSFHGSVTSLSSKSGSPKPDVKADSKPSSRPGSRPGSRAGSKPGTPLLSRVGSASKKGSLSGSGSSSSIASMAAALAEAAVDSARSEPKSRVGSGKSRPPSAAQRSASGSMAKAAMMSQSSKAFGTRGSAGSRESGEGSRGSEEGSRPPSAGSRTGSGRIKSAGKRGGPPPLPPKTNSFKIGLRKVASRVRLLNSLVSSFGHGSRQNSADEDGIEEEEPPEEPEPVLSENASKVKEILLIENLSDSDAASRLLDYMQLNQLTTPETAAAVQEAFGSLGLSGGATLLKRMATAIPSATMGIDESSTVIGSILSGQNLKAIQAVEQKAKEKKEREIARKKRAAERAERLEKKLAARAAMSALDESEEKTAVGSGLFVASRLSGARRKKRLSSASSTSSLASEQGDLGMDTPTTAKKKQATTFMGGLKAGILVRKLSGRGKRSSRPGSVSSNSSTTELQDINDGGEGGSFTTKVLGGVKAIGLVRRLSGKSRTNSGKRAGSAKSRGSSGKSRIREESGSTASQLVGGMRALGLARRMSGRKKDSAGSVRRDATLDDDDGDDDIMEEVEDDSRSTASQLMGGIRALGLSRRMSGKKRDESAKKKKMEEEIQEESRKSASQLVGGIRALGLARKISGKKSGKRSGKVSAKEEEDLEDAEEDAEEEEEEGKGKKSGGFFGGMKAAGFVRKMSGRKQTAAEKKAQAAKAIAANLEKASKDVEKAAEASTSKAKTISGFTKGSGSGAKSKAQKGDVKTVSGSMEQGGSSTDSSSGPSPEPHSCCGMRSSWARRWASRAWPALCMRCCVRPVRPPPPDKGQGWWSRRRRGGDVEMGKDPALLSGKKLSLCSRLLRALSCARCCARLCSCCSCMSCTACCTRCSPCCRKCCHRGAVADMNPNSSLDTNDAGGRRKSQPNLKNKRPSRSLPPPPSGEVMPDEAGATHMVRKIDPTLLDQNSVIQAAIPVLPLQLAWFCLVCNVLVPGLGTIFSGAFCLCVGMPRITVEDRPENRLTTFLLDLIVGIGQAFTVVFCLVGWGWSIWWGTIMVRLAKKQRRILTRAAEELNKPPPKPKGKEGEKVIKK